MTGPSGNRLRTRLRNIGLSNGAIAAAWPRWWSDEAGASISARADLAFSVARRLGLDPGSLLDDQAVPRFLWREEARFKHLSNESDLERAGITSFGRAVAAALIQATPTPAASISGASAVDLRRQILASGRPFVGLVDMLSLCWATGIPVIHLRVFPWSQKRMAAMAARLGDRWAVLLGKDSRYPAPIAFYLGHELGHIALEQLDADRLVVDFETEGTFAQSEDEEERAADEFSLELLTGEPRPKVVPLDPAGGSARELARVATSAAPELHIEPGVLAQLFGFSTGEWPTATGALKHIYPAGRPVWEQVNAIARRELALDQISVDAAEFLEAVLGLQTA